MKNFNNNLIIIVLMMALIPFLNSCESKESQDDQLTGFMLGGIYFIDGYGGMDRVAEILITEEGRSTDKELIEGYKVLLEYPFEISQKTENKSYLREFWDISNKNSLLDQMEVLKNREQEYKAWDYARIVNLAASGYAAEYLTKDEVQKAIAEILPLAREKYDTWEAYYAGYNDGLKDWDAQSQQVISFGKLSKDILSHSKSIYKLLPLHRVKK